MVQRFMKLGPIAAAVALLAAACGAPPGQSQAKADDDDKEQVAVPVEVEAVDLATVFAAYNGTTTLEADREADIVAKTSGVVLEILVEEGDPVAEGQVVARLDRERLELELARAKATLARLENDLRRTRELFEKKLISSEAYEKAKFDVDQELAGYEMVKLELSYTDVRAPIAGVISERLVKVGKLVDLHEALFRVHDFDPLLAILHVPERELATLRNGQQARLAVDALESETFTGRVARISPVVDPGTGTFKVTVEMDNDGGLLKPGMFGRVNIVYDVRERAVTIPQDALVVEDRDRYVFVLEGKRAKRVEVTTGYTTAGRVEILNGLAPGQWVVTAGKGGIAAETLLDPINLPPEEAATAEVAGDGKLAGAENSSAR